MHVVSATIRDIIGALSFPTTICPLWCWLPYVSAFFIILLILRRFAPRPYSVFCYPFVWFVGLDASLPDPVHSGEEGFGDALSVLAFILTQMIALTVSQIGRRPLKDEPIEFRITTLVTYGLIAIPIFGTLVCMMRATTINENGHRKRKYGPAALKFMRLVFGTGLALAVIFPSLAWCGDLPTQVVLRKVELHNLHAQSHQYVEGDPRIVGTTGIRISLPLSNADFPQGIPNQMVLEVSVRPQLYDAGWRVLNLEIYDGEPEQHHPHKPPAVADSTPDLEEPPARLLEFEASRFQPGGRYTAAILLWKEKVTGEDIRSMTRILNDPKQEAITVVALTKEK